MAKEYLFSAVFFLLFSSSVAAECSASEAETIYLQDYLYRLVISNSSLSNYNAYSNFSVSDCSNYSNNSRAFDVSMLIFENFSLVKGINVSSKILLYDDLNISKIGDYTLSEYYDFLSVFSERENKVLSYVLKKMFIDGTGREIWVSVLPAVNCSLFRENLASLPGIKEYQDTDSTCMAYAKTYVSDIKLLVNDWVNVIYFYTDKAYYDYKGISNTSIDLSAVLKMLNNCNICRYSGWTDCADYNIDSGKCYVNYMDRTRISTYKYSDSISIYVNGEMNSSAEVSVKNFNPDGVSEDDKLRTTNITNEYLAGMFNKSVTLSYYPVEPAGIDINKTVSRNYVAASSFQLDYLNMSKLDDFEKKDFFSYSLHSAANESVTIGKNYVCILSEGIMFTPESVRADIFTEQRDDNFARQDLTKKVSKYISINGSLWSLSAKLVTEESKNIFRFDEDEFFNATMKLDTSVPSSDTPDYFVFIIIIIILAMAALLLIFFMW